MSRTQRDVLLVVERHAGRACGHARSRSPWLLPATDAAPISRTLSRYGSSPGDPMARAGAAGWPRRDARHQGCCGPCGRAPPAPPGSRPARTAARTLCGGWSPSAAASRASPTTACSGRCSRSRRRTSRRGRTDPPRRAPGTAGWCPVRSPAPQSGPPSPPRRRRRPASPWGARRSARWSGLNESPLSCLPPRAEPSDDVEAVPVRLERLRSARTRSPPRRSPASTRS